MPKVAKTTAELTPLTAASAALVAGSYYVPKDFMAPGVRRVAVQCVGCAAGLGVYLLDVQQRRAGAESGSLNPEQQLTPEQQAELQKLTELAESQKTSRANHPVKGWLIGTGVLAGAAGLMGASIWATLKIDRWAVGALRKRGVTYPNSVWGAVNFAAAIATLAFDD